MSEPLELRLTIAPQGDAYTARVDCHELGTDAGPFPFALPLDDAILDELRWYLEQYIRWPVGEEERAARVANQLEGWGRALFAAVFTATEAARVWTQFRLHEPDRPRLVTLDCTESPVLRLPWELLADEEGHLFALGIGFRRRLHKVAAARPRAFELPVRVLLVIARPEGDGASFIDPRASGQALLEAVKPLGNAVAVEFLPAGTLKSLTDRLNARHAPPVHIVHFDGHGVYSQARGLGYLLFEDKTGKPDRVDADQLGNLLARAGIPLMILDACQSAHGDAPDPYSSVAQRLIRAGVGSVVAMQYSILVAASKQFFAAFYTALAEGSSIGQAVDAGRYDLLAETGRFVLHHPDGSDRPISLRDWFLPALYQQAADPSPFFNAKAQGGKDAKERESEKAGERKSDPFAVYEAGLGRMLPQLAGEALEVDARTLEARLRENLRFARVDGDTETRRAERSAILRELNALCERALGLPFDILCAPAVSTPTHPVTPSPHHSLLGDFPQPRYGFIGRARELWRLERLLAERRIVVLHAFGGQGKTALAAEAADWLTQKGRFARAVFLSFEPGYAADAALTQLGRLLVGQDFSSLGEAERLPALRRALAEAPTLLIWDNFESVLPGSHAALPEADLTALLDLAAALVSPTKDSPTNDYSTTRLLVTTRNLDPDDLPHPAFRPGQTTALLPLEGLTHWEALELAGNILDALSHPRPPRLDLERLLDFLGGHPLSIQLVTPHLQDYPSVQTVIDRFEDLYPGFAEGQARNESLEVSLRFSLDRLSEAARARIAALGVFEGGALEFVILMVTGLKPSEWRPARAELLRAGLAMAEMESPFSIETAEGAFGGHFLRFHPTLARALRRRLDADTLAALETAYRQAYHRLANHLYHNDSRAPQTTRAVAQRELPNLRRGVTLTLAAGDMATAVTFAECVERFLNVFGRWREREVLMGEVARAFAGRPEGITGHRSSVSGQPSAVEPFTKTEYLLQSRQGQMLLDAGRAREAEAVFRGLLARMDETDYAVCTTDYVYSENSIEFGYDRAQILHRLGRSLMGQGRVGEAEAVYQQALDVLASLAFATTDYELQTTVTETAIQGETGGVHTDLADVLMFQNRYAEAREHYEAALEIVAALGDGRNGAVVLGQLGTLALEENNFAEAERLFCDAIQRFHNMGEPHHEAISWHQLGMTYQMAANHKPQAESNQQSASSNQLLYQAEEAYQSSLQLEEVLGNLAGAAQTANQLAAIAAITGRPADAARWCRRALADFQASGQLREVAVVANNLAYLLLAAARGEYGNPPPVGLLLGASTPGTAKTGELLAEAESLARQAVQIRETVVLDVSNEIWTTYGILAGIAEIQGNPAAAHEWCRKERAAFVAFPGHWANLSRPFGGLVRAIIGGIQGDPAVLEALEQLYPQMLAGGLAWHAMPEAIRRLLAGERDLDALADELSIPAAQYLLLHKALEALAGGVQAVHESDTNARMDAAPPEISPDQEAQARALMAALEAWLATPPGQSALRELQSQGLAEEALLMGLLQRFMAAHAGGASPPRGDKGNK